MEKLKGTLLIFLLRMLALLPWYLIQKLGSLVGIIMWLTPNRSKEVTRINLNKCFPELSEEEVNTLSKKTLIGIGKTSIECACFWVWPAKKSLALIKEVEGLDILKSALNSGKGVVGITSHLGNWELINHFFCSQCNPIIFYRPPKIKMVDEFIQKQRAKMGNRVAPSTREGIINVMKEVRRGGVVGIPADPEPSRTAGVFVPFFATKVLSSKFVANMLTGHKSVGVFLHAIRLPDNTGFKVVIEAAPEEMYSEDINIAVASMSKTVESYVSKWTTQYMWSMKRFKNRPEGEKRWY